MITTTKTRFRFIQFRWEEFPGWWECTNNKSGAVLGTVEWYKTWRSWVFQSEETSVFSADCLRDIATFMEGLEKP